MIVQRQNIPPPPPFPPFYLNNISQPLSFSLPPSFYPNVSEKYNKIRFDEIIEILQKNNITKFQNYIQENNILLHELNNDTFDILIYAIENNVSIDILKYIINNTKYITYNYHIIDNDNNRIKTPLMVALANNNFYVANLLLKKNADINYLNEDIINNLWNQRLLNQKNLKFILNHSYNIEFITSSLIIDFINCFENDILEIIFKYYIFDNDFILNLLNNYYNQDNQEALTDLELENIIKNERKKITITDEMYKNAISKKNYKAYQILFECDDHDNFLILCKIEKYHLLEKAVQSNDISFLKFILSYKPINYKSFNFEKILKKSNDNNNYEMMKLILDSAINSLPKQSNGTYESAYINFVLNKVINLKNLKMIKYVVESESYKSSIKLDNDDIYNNYPIFTALYIDNIEIFKYLIGKGADCNIKNKDNVSLLSLVISHQKILELNYLLQVNVNINEKDVNGNYPFINAIYKNNLDMVILLNEY